MVEVTTASPKYLGANGLRRVPAEARSRWAIVSPPPSWKASRGGRGGTPDRLGARVALCGSRTKPVRRLGASVVAPRTPTSACCVVRGTRALCRGESDSGPSIQPGQASVARSPAMVTKTS